MRFLEMTILFISKWVAEKGPLLLGWPRPIQRSTTSELIFKISLSYALDKVLEADVPNIKLLWVDGDSLTNYFEDGEIDQLYLNFSDPWPKKRHEKRRLTYKTFLDTFKQILPEHGEIHFKTDNRGLFEYSLVSFSQYGMTLKGVWLDLHASDFEGNVMTEYEEKFSVKYDVSFSIQKPSTDTVAAAMDNTTVPR